MGNFAEPYEPGARQPYYCSVKYVDICTSKMVDLFADLLLNTLAGTSHLESGENENKIH